MEVVAADLSGPIDSLVKVLSGIDVVISGIGPGEQLAQIPLATAAKKAHVKRFIPCAFITVAAPGGIMTLRDQKELVYNHIKQLCLPFTIIDVGWWYQISIPRLPSGRIDDFAAAVPMSTFINDGQTPSALTDVRDIGRYVAKIIADDRTLNKYVLAYDEVWTPSQVYAKLEQLSGEQLPRESISEEQLRNQLQDSNRALEQEGGAGNYSSFLNKVMAEYQISWGVRGDNTPEYAKYLGYLTTKELYPDFDFVPFETFLREVLDGKMKGVYQENEALLQVLAAKKSQQ